MFIYTTWYHQQPSQEGLNVGLLLAGYYLLASKTPPNDHAIQENLFLPISCADNIKYSAFEDAALLSQDFRRLIFAGSKLKTV